MPAMTPRVHCGSDLLTSVERRAAEVNAFLTPYGLAALNRLKRCALQRMVGDGLALRT